jgi:diguanylate cyclase (GGDEF)-like protein
VRADTGRVRQGLERLLERWRPYDARRLTRRELLVETVTAAVFVAIATAMAVGLESRRELDLVVALGLVVSLALASRVRLYLGAGFAMPTQLVLVPMLFLLPAPDVPAAVACSLALAALIDVGRRRAHPERVVTGVSDALHAVTPSLVFCAAGEPEAGLAASGVLALALSAQCATDLLTAIGREWLGRGIPPAVQMQVMLSVYLVDVCLTPIGLAVAVVGAQEHFGFLIVLPLIGLFALLAVDRRARIQEAVGRLDELSREHERLDRAVHRIGEAFASKPDRTALVDLVLRSAVETLDAEFGRSGAIVVGRPDVALAAAEQAARRTGELQVIRVVDGVAMAHPLGEDVLAVGRRGRAFTAEEQALFAYLAQQTAVAMENVELHDQLRRQATVDELTGLANHRRFQEVLAHETLRTRRSGRPLALALLDIDDFKLINDTYGHQQGDVVLAAVADVVRGACRATDEPARYGGEELAVILSDTDLDGAYTVAESMRRAIAAMSVPGSPGVTASVGVAVLPPYGTGDPAALIAAADAALYEAKRAGKNRTRRGGGRFTRHAAGREA